MPKPLPDYLPDEVKLILMSSGTTMKDMAPKKTSSRLYSFFGGTHLRIRPYKRMAEWLGISLDEMRMAIQTQTLKKLVQEKVASDPHCGNWGLREISIYIQSGDDWILDRYREKSNHCLDSYKEVADLLGWSIDKLVTVCIQAL